MIGNMKITQEDQTKLEELFAANVESYGYKDLQDYVAQFNQAVKDGKITIISCAATRCFCNILNGAALSFVCKTIYEYAHDDHLTTFYKKLYKKYS